MSAERRLADLGITLPEVAAPVAAYVPAVLSGSHVYTAGQLPLVDGQLMATGRLGVDVDIETAAACARVSALNGLAAVRSVIGSLDRVVHIVKVVGFVASDPSFTSQSAVVNGASEVLLDVFGDAGRHARSSVGMAVLPLNAPVEIELIVEVAT